jgi:nitrite reductase/ring-hydroxylating ferredoxin subunit
MLTERDVIGGPLLSDGTPISELFDLENHEVSLRLFSDPEVWKLEQRYLFARTWNMLAHESEIPHAGDFVTRYIGLDQVIVVRDDDGDVSVMLNVCMHRGMAVCRTDRGNESSFKCPYHGWVYSKQGLFLGAPAEREMYRVGLDKPAFALKKPRVEMYAGFVFANWDHDAESFEDYLGPHKFYLDLVFASTDDGLEVVGSPQRIRINANWKAPSEQFLSPDGYHVATMHRSAIEAAMGTWFEGAGADVNLLFPVEGQVSGVDVSTDRGHGLRAGVPGTLEGLAQTKDLGIGECIARLVAMTSESGAQAMVVGMPPELVPQMAKHLSLPQLRLLAAGPPNLGGIFPNMGILGLNVRVYLPRDQDTLELINWSIVPKGASDEFKAGLRKSQLAGFGTTGTLEMDDAEAWPAVQRSARGFMGGQHSMKYMAQNGENKPDGWEGPGTVHAGVSADDGGWKFWMRYRDFMMGHS